MSIPRVELYILSSSRSGQAALEHFKRMRARFPDDQVEWAVIDPHGPAGATAPERLLALPTLICRLDGVERRCFGDFAHIDATLAALGLTEFAVQA